ncbi:sialate O-acetylesterase [Sphingomonas sp. Leaf4]|uniref:sialate O-acetylesterase n=1 Tax=Sphingomonas sp. Leaf4 TaxID=2876553 RepID=UPI001E4F45C5|nr:sialate O-acetylesterase [Sphingomonas sp. Leaf4]
MAIDARFGLRLRRNEARTFLIRVIGLSAETLAAAVPRMQIRDSQDAAGAPLVDLGVVSGDAQGIRIEPLAIEGGVPRAMLRVQISKATATNPAIFQYGALGEPVPFAYGLQWGGTTRLHGEIEVVGNAIDSDGAPANRPLHGGAADQGAIDQGLTLTIAADQVVDLVIDGAGQLGDIAAVAKTEADRAVAAGVTATAARDGAKEILDKATARGREVASTRYAAVTTDQSDKVVDAIGLDGVSRVASARIRTLNGRRPEAMTLGQLPFAGQNLTAMTLMLNAGQSLAANHSGGGNMTLTQPGKALAFPFGVDAPAAVAATLLPLISTDANVTGAEVAIRDGEAPLFGMCEFLAELIQKENGLSPADLGLVPVTAQNARGGTAIVENNKGTARYQRGIAQAGALRTIAQAGGGRARCFGVAWYQGESDVPNGYAYYLQKLRELARDYSADLRAALPEQGFAPHLVTYQTCQYSTGTDPFGVGRAQLQAAIDFAAGTVPAGFASAPPVGFSTPIYHMDFRADPTGVHVKARDAKWLGAYAALYFKRVFIDGAGWPPMVPIAVEREGRALYIRYRLRSPAVRLIVAEGPGFDGLTVPAQPGRGWAAAAAAGGAIGLAQVPDVVAPDTIRVVLARAPVNGDRLLYAQSASVKMRPFVGGAGNFRDTHGDLVRYDAINRRMDNWLPAHSIVLDASSGGFQIG